MNKINRKTVLLRQMTCLAKTRINFDSIVGWCSNFTARFYRPCSIMGLLAIINCSGKLSD